MTVVQPSSKYRRRRIGLTATVALVAGGGVYAGAGVGDIDSRAPRADDRAPASRPVLTAERRLSTAAPARHAVAVQTPPPRPRASSSALQVKAPASVGAAWTATALVDGAPAAWLAQRASVTLMRFDQSRVHLTLHAGYNDGGTSGWMYGDRITPREIHKVIAAFNGGFKLSYPRVGFVSAGHVAVPLKPGLGSIVTYTDGTTDVGAWRAGVPNPRRTVLSVLQNQRLLVDHGVAAASVARCIFVCWGATVGSEKVVARSGLGVTTSGQLVWAAGERLTPFDLARALIVAGAVRAIELDINLDWVAGYLYAHHPSGPSPVPVVPGQHGITGELLQPDSRDFLAVIAN